VFALNGSPFFLDKRTSNQTWALSFLQRLLVLVLQLFGADDRAGGGRREETPPEAEAGARTAAAALVGILLWPCVFTSNTHDSRNCCLILSASLSEKAFGWEAV